MSNKKLLLSEIAVKVQGQLDGKDLSVSEVSEIDKGSNESISFIDNPIYIKKYFSTKCSALIVGIDFEHTSKTGLSLIRVENPRLALLKLINLMYPQINKNNDKSDSDYISSESQIGNNVKIGNNCSISSRAIIGDDVCIGNNVIIEHDVIIGQKTIIQSGAVIGSDGFGTVKDNDKHLNFPHIGKVIIGNDVWIGSNTTIDRGSIGDTIIGDNTKIDNLIQIAHNVKIGKSCLIASGTAIAGTSIIGNNVSIGGQVGIVGHLKIGDNCMIGAKSLVTKSFTENLFISGNPAMLHKKRIKQDVALRKLTNNNS
ncbi:MAG: UDP-3-O-(3-hydroxymyristoyl)glucosamine N-acyltransferase [Candidatus Marinimicrobia bacterium]|nr:UDP-3-O-(3-hydroxymyristoyl)glucosamine N-acyltransferase [Candidatus Neomarinimicrobiota bacterium]